MHHQFTVNENATEDSLSLTIKNKLQQAFVRLESTFSNTNPVFNDSILIIKKGSIPQQTSFKMVLSLEDKTRIGSSDVGEELVSFFSRYGVRFDRLD
jgi:hypothetical protein